MRVSFLIIAFLTSQLSAAQSKQDYIWVFGHQSTEEVIERGYIYDFNISPFPTQKLQIGNGIGGQSASICSDSGNLLFYSNGCSIMDRNHTIMPRGDSLNYNIWYDLAWGGTCQRGYPGRQDIIILLDPNYIDGYYIFHKAVIYDDGYTYPELRYSYVDMQENDGNGDVVIKNIKMPYEGIPMGSYLTAIHHENGKDWWLINGMQEDSSYLVYLIDEAGIHETERQPSFQYFTEYRSSASGTAKFSPDGSKFALYNWHDQLHIYDFDRSTGLLSNHKKVEIYPPEEIDIEEIRFSSVEWSPNSRFLYTASILDLHQVDLWEEDYQDGIQLIDTYNGTQDPLSTTFQLMALGPDCKIYVTMRSSSNSHHVIHRPNELGSGCNFLQNDINLPFTTIRGCFPNHPRFRVDEEEKCDPTITSIFGEAVYYRRDLEVYPNPTAGPVAIKIPEEFEKGELAVIDMNGTVVISREINRSYNGHLDLGNLPIGLYAVEIYPNSNKDKVFWSTKVVVE